MADLITVGKPGKRNKPTPRIDLTPMVDLGFLLITFFMFTTSLANQKALELTIPSNEVTDRPTTFPEEATITIIPTASHKVAYYYGAQVSKQNIQYTDVAHVRQILRQKQANVTKLPASFSADAHKLHVIIRPGQHSIYSDLVSLLDEMTILDIKLYTIADITPLELVALEK